MRADVEPPIDQSAYRFCHRVRVRFAETDAMGIVHHAAYLPYLESGRVEYLRTIGHPYDAIREAGLELPVAEIAMRYLRPCRFDELVDVHVAVVSARGATFTIAYLLSVDGEPRATGVSVHAVTRADGRPTRCPGWLLGLAGA